MAKTRLYMILKDSLDTCISVAGIEIERGRKRSVCQGMKAAPNRLVHQDIVGTINKDREGQEQKIIRRKIVQGEKLKKKQKSESFLACPAGMPM